MKILYATLNVTGLPKPQPRVKAFRRGNHAGVYTPPTAQGWKECVMIEAAPFAGRQIEGPIAVHLVFTLPCPKAHKEETYVITKPDLDNLVKSSLDALTDRAVWRDDSQVAELCARKIYVNGDVNPGAVITIYTIGGEQWM
jgi:Holliday junction resolvase RusA-like endonuclease